MSELPRLFSNNESLLPAKVGGIYSLFLKNTPLERHRSLSSTQKFTKLTNKQSPAQLSSLNA
jgi:hypothetical protein